jgi:hypothetical protein
VTDEERTPDPKALRALAHPARWQLVDLLGSEGTATATRCAEVLGESVASCSYHLRMLAKYGYIEEAPGRAGKEKPWRLASPRSTAVRRGLGRAAGHPGEGQLSMDRFGALRDRRFRRLFAGQALSSFGDTAMYLTLGIWAKTLTGSNAAAGGK